MLQDLRTALRWPPGLALITWRYMWDTMPLHRSVEPGDSADLPPALPDRDPDDQPLLDGVGPLYHRTFSVQIPAATLTAPELIDLLTGDINRAMPSEAAVVRFAQRGSLQVGDEAVVTMPGPWNGPVRVIDRSPTSFRFATLQGHLEAGQIEFRATPDHPGLQFTVEVWARPASRLINLLYTRLRLAKEIQLNMWVRFCVAAADLAGGHPAGGVTIRTRQLSAEDLPAPVPTAA